MNQLKVMDPYECIMFKVNCRNRFQENFKQLKKNESVKWYFQFTVFDLILIVKSFVYTYRNYQIFNFL